MRVSNKKIEEVALKISGHEKFDPSKGSIDDNELKRLCRLVGFNATSDRTIKLLHEALCDL